MKKFNLIFVLLLNSFLSFSQSNLWELTDTEVSNFSNDALKFRKSIPTTFKVYELDLQKFKNIKELGVPVIVVGGTLPSAGLHYCKEDIEAVANLVAQKMLEKNLHEEKVTILKDLQKTINKNKYEFHFKEIV